MTTYKVNHDIGYFGHDNPATAVRESVPFTVQPMTDPDPVTGFFFVNVGIVAGAHGSHVAGITAGNRLFGGQMSGAAPGAKIVSVRVCLFTGGLHDARADRGDDLRGRDRPTWTSST